MERWRRTILIFATSVLVQHHLTSFSLAQQGSLDSSRQFSLRVGNDLPGRQFSQAIEDNSFLIEEAYNQEEGIVQHISNGMYAAAPTEDFVFSFTQEWPLFGQANQLSYTIPYQFLSSNTVRGVADILINYRYQLLTKEDWAAMSPRISLIIPTGDKTAGLGNGTYGVQLNIPTSKRLSEEFVLHMNAGVTFMPHSKGTTSTGIEISETLVGYNTGGSIIWLALPELNVMLETVVNISDEFEANGTVARSTTTIVSPGLRYAIDIGSLQIVPGLGVPFSFTSDSWHGGIFLYLSFEHPF